MDKDRIDIFAKKLYKMSVSTWKVAHTISNLEDGIQRHNKVSFHTHKERLVKKLWNSHVDEGVEKLECSNIADGNVTQSSKVGEKFLKKLNRVTVQPNTSVPL